MLHNYDVPEGQLIHHRRSSAVVSLLRFEIPLGILFECLLFFSVGLLQAQQVDSCRLVPTVGLSIGCRVIQGHHGAAMS